MAATRSVACKRCGRGGLRWTQNRAGAWYLCNAMGDGMAMTWSAHTCGSESSLVTDTPTVARALLRFDACDASVQAAFMNEIVNAVRDANKGRNEGDVHAAALAAVRAPRDRAPRLCACGAPLTPLFEVDGTCTGECATCLVDRVLIAAGVTR